MKKSTRSNPIRKYNKLFKFLTFDLSFLACIFIALVVLLYMFVIFGLLKALEVKELERMQEGSSYLM